MRCEAEVARENRENCRAKRGEKVENVLIWREGGGGGGSAGRYSLHKEVGLGNG